MHTVHVTLLMFQEMREAYDLEGSQTGRDPLLMTAAVAVNRDIVENAYEVDLITPLSLKYHIPIHNAKP